MAEDHAFNAGTGDTSAHDPADHGHHGHHVLPLKTLLMTFGALVALTVLTVVLALFEREGWVHFGAAGSVVVALFIAGVKATLVAMFFMALKYDNKVNALAFSLAIVFLGVFFVFTFLDTGFRDTFDDWSVTPVDEVEFEERRLLEESEQIAPQIDAESLVLPGDTALIGPPPTLE